MENMNPGMPNLAEQARARKAVIDTLTAASNMLSSMAEAHNVPTVSDGASGVDIAFESGLKAGIEHAARALLQQAARTRRAAIV